MSEISEKGSSLLNRVEAKVRTTAFVKTNKAHKDEREAINELEDYIASLESELASTKARLAGYEVGYDPATNPPKDMEQVLFVDEYGEFYRGGFDSEGKYWWQTVVITSSHISGQGGEIPQETIIRWFLLPGSKGGEA